MARFHKLKVKEITHETADCVSVVFDVPASLKDEFRYLAGQYLTLKIPSGGEDVRRSYSLCSSPVADTEYRVAIKKVKEGRGSVYINEKLKVGDELEVMTPMGNFHSPMDEAHAKQYVLFAGGSGITPMLSILKTVLKAEPQSTVTLIYGNRDEQSVIFKKTIDTLAAENKERFEVIHVLENPPAGTDERFRGLLTEEKVRRLLEENLRLNADNEFFICGPGPMMENVKAVLTAMNVDPKRIHIEYFTAVAEAVKAAEAEGARIVSKVTIIMDGEELNVDLASDGKVILDVAIDGGLDAPYACKGAVCCTCRAKILEGKMRMDQNYALSDEEIEQGYILTCQAHPVSERVIVSYDEP
ncbi:MAG TPA: 2Fe-2S iron-sulfur cluster-binding protein [Bacteroidia bacterium]|nr:2Fe-2S iron-sulfur cluster-binding protein [Bacteroidia bacterium]